MTFASVVTYGGTAAPGTASTIAATSTLPAGQYRCTVTAYVSGTAAAGDLNNLQLLVGGTASGRLMLVPVINTIFQNPPITVSFADPASVIAVGCPGAAGATSTYNVQMVVDPIVVWP